MRRCLSRAGKPNSMKGGLIFCTRAQLVPCSQLRQRLRATRWRATPLMTTTGCRLFMPPGSLSDGVPETHWPLPTLLHCASSCGTVECRGSRPVTGAYFSSAIKSGRTAKGHRAVSPAISLAVPDTGAFLSKERRRLHSVAANLHRHNILRSGIVLDSASTTSSAASPVAAELGSFGAPPTPVNPICLAEPCSDFMVAKDLNASSTASATLDTVISPAEPSEGSYAKELFQHIQESVSPARQWGLLQ